MLRNVIYSVIFDRKRELHKIENDKVFAVDKDKLALIQVRVYDSRTKKSKFFSTGVKVRFENWDFKRLQIIKLNNASALNKQINDTVNELQTIEQRLKVQNRFNLDTLQHEFKGNTDTSKFYEYAQKYLNERKNTIEHSTYKSIKSSVNLFNKWKENVLLCEISVNLLQSFKSYLAKEFAPNTAVKRLNHLRQILKSAKNEGLIEKSPFSVVTVGSYDAKQKPLTLIELQVIESVQVSSEKPHLQLAKDLFLFSCYTALSFVDVMSLDKSQILPTNEGNIIQIERQKTKSISIVPISVLFEGKPQTIIDKYITENSPKIFPQKSNQKINKALKELAQLANFERFTLSFSVARATCATALLNLGLDMDLVAKVLGHNSTKYTKDYAKFQSSTIANKIANVFDSIKK